MNSQRKAEIKKSVLSFVNHCKKTGVNLGLPVPVKAMAKAIPGCRVIPYSVHCKRYQLTRKQMIEYTQTDDACADYDTNTEQTLIFYNDLDANKMKSNRYRWNIAHEIGHLWLKHHIKYEECRLFRSTMSDALYNQLENEADTFAAYLLVPHGAVAVFSKGRPINQEWIMKHCRISRPAAYQRIVYYNQWYNDSGLQNSHRFRDIYDSQMARLFSECFTCKNCKSKVISHYSWMYCPICGESKFFYDEGESALIYSSPNVNSTGKPYLCPVCKNEETDRQGEFCQICGTYLTNHCIAQNDLPFYESESCCKEAERLPSNARYCPYCGEKTFFFVHSILPEWKASPENVLEDDIEEIDEELPF